jgi:predicted phosphodiesterase
MGNTDWTVVEGARDGTDDPEVKHTIDQIGEDGVAYLASLPFSRRISPRGTSGTEHDLLVVHANPRNMDDPIAPNLSDEDVRRLTGDVDAAVIAFGHIHICYTRRIDDILLVDVSAVGNPKDGDLRCKYGILTWDPQSWSWNAEIRKLPYPLEETEVQIRASGLPDPEGTIRQLRKATY